jgi:hypothetical protein
LALAISVVAVPPVLAQGEVASTASPALSRDAIEQLLLKGQVVGTKKSKQGVTDTKRVTLKHESFTHDAQIQAVDIALPIFQVDPKHTEVDFKDTYRYNIAAYRLSLMLGLDSVPMSVEREIEGKPSSVTWWVDDVMMEEGDRLKKKQANDRYGPSQLRTMRQLQNLRVFDELIQNRDRNGGNLLWTKDWKMWMIDHTRAFRIDKELRQPKLLEACERSMFEKMKGLTAEQLVEVMGKAMTKREIEALLARRDRIVKIFNEKIAGSTEAAVLFTMPS